MTPSEFLNISEKPLKNKSAAKWAADLERIEDIPTRFAVARLVWFDWFGHYTVANRTDAFDKYLVFKPDLVSDDKIIDGLVTVGYDRYKAYARLYKNRGQTGGLKSTRK